MTSAPHSSKPDSRFWIVRQLQKNYRGGRGGFAEDSLTDTSPPRPKGAPKLSVEFRCDENGRITAVARDNDTAKENYLNITLRGTRSEGEVSEESKLMSEATIS